MITTSSLPTRANFNPRSPCGERLFPDVTPLIIKYLFQSTLPVRGATDSDAVLLSGAWDFNPRSPCGERHNTRVFASSRSQFQSTLPVRGATRQKRYAGHCQNISIHAPRAGSDSNIAQISDDRAAILRHGFQTISPPTAEKSLSANKKLFLMPFSAREPPGFFMFTAGSRPAAGQKINVSVTSIEGLAPICFTLPSYAEPIT